MKVREDRRRNVIVKVLEVKEEKREETVQRLFREIEVEAEIMRIKRLEGMMEKEKETMWV